MPTRLHARERATPERVRVTVRDSYLMGELYVPTDHRSSVARPCVAVTGSLTSVKEQMAGIYAAEMSRRGIIALAIDYRNDGESGGAARQHEDPSSKAEDLSAAVAHLAERFGRSSGVGLLGICTSGGNVIQAAAREHT